MSDSPTCQYREHTLPDRNDWEVSTVARRTTNRDETATFPVTSVTVSLDESHYYIIIRKPGTGKWQRREYDAIVVADGALGELDAWLEDE